LASSAVALASSSARLTRFSREHRKLACEIVLHASVPTVSHVDVLELGPLRLDELPSGRHFVRH
jgi:hypothetical protein